MGPNVKDYQPGDKVLINFSNPTEIVVNDPVLTETTLLPGNTPVSPMRRITEPVQYFLKWEHDILCKVLSEDE